MIGFRQCLGMAQNVFPIHLVIELIKAESRLVLRLSIQLDLKVPNLIGVSRLIANHRSFLPFKHTRSKGPSLHRRYPASSVPLTLSDAPMARRPF